MRALLFALSWLLLGLSSAYAAPALSVNLEAPEGALDFILSAEGAPLSADALKVAFVKGRLVIEVDGVEATRAWQKGWSHPMLDRALLYPHKSKKGKTPKATLKVKFTRKPPKEGLKDLQVIERENGSVAVRLPWEGAAGMPALAPVTSAPAPAAEVPAPTPAGPAPVEVDEKGSTLAEAPRAPEQVFADPDAHAPEPQELRRIYKELAAAQTQEARARAAVPRVLALPFGRLSGDDPALDQLALMSTRLLDEQMIHSPALVWVGGEESRAYATHLRDNAPQLDLEKARALAAHEGADMILRSGLRFEPGRAGIVRLNSQLISTRTGEVSNELNFFISSDRLQAAFEQAWVHETRAGAVTRAVLFPGWGHVYRGERGAGWGYAGVGFALLTGAVASTVAGFLATRDYNTNAPTSAHRRADANAHYDRANLLWAGYGATWLASLLSTIAQAQERSYLDMSRLDWAEIEGAR
jgi:hypothetical protein